MSANKRGRPTRLKSPIGIVVWPAQNRFLETLIDSGWLTTTLPKQKLYHLLPKSNVTCPPCGPSIGGQTSGRDSFETLDTSIKGEFDNLLNMHLNKTILSLSISPRVVLSEARHFVGTFGAWCAFNRGPKEL